MVYAHGDEAGLGRRNKLPRLMDCVVDPRELLAPGSNLRLNGYYYITKQVYFDMGNHLNFEKEIMRKREIPCAPA